MSKHILKELPELVQAQVITEETAKNIQEYYNQRPSQSANRLFIVFGILGSLLIGIGLVLIIAHNWDVLPKMGKLAIGFFPLVVGQAIAGYALVKKPGDQAWREGPAAFLFFAIAICISIVSQVYNIEGELGGFLFIWMCLALPIAYILRSSVASLLFIIGITWYGCEVGYFNYPHGHAPAYWILLLLILPFYYLEFIRKNIRNNFFYFHSWFLVISATVCLGLFTDQAEEMIVAAYMSLFSVFIIMSQIPAFETRRVLTNAFLVVGSLGVIVLLLALSFDWYWEEINEDSFNLALDDPGIIASLGLMFVASFLLAFLLKSKRWDEINSKSYAFVIFAILFFIAFNAPGLSQILVNVLILVLAVHTIRDGANRNHLGIMNYGLLIITALITSRFFDTDFSFVVRGLLFIAIGAGFFAANYYMIQKRKKQL
ncbi:MAG TPA: DUF2157 domain-containing protein [Chryseolinea sp.]